ncbi:thioredoxin family protein [Oceanobacillus sp. FSL H7-0719]|uniref:thioredoxin family protein n=1 Tax=Oceanobacillus sp. FSL H7-0719 TaxID=2954507 RepID=UPI003243B87E
MKEITDQELKNERLLLYIYSPFCGTCSVARAMLEKIEAIHQTEIFYEMNASYYEKFLHEYKVESVPCLLIKENNQVKEKIYTFYSTGNIYHYLVKYKPELFVSPS